MTLEPTTVPLSQPVVGKGCPSQDVGAIATTSGLPFSILYSAGDPVEQLRCQGYALAPTTCLNQAVIGSLLDSQIVS